MNIKQNGNRHHSHAQKRQQTTRPRHAQLVIHLDRKQRKPRASEGAHERVPSNSRVRQHKINIDDIIERAHEDDEDAGADGDAGEHLRHPGDVGAGRPREPEEADGEDAAADDHGGQAVFGDDAVVVLAHLARERRFGDVCDVDAAREDLLGN